MQLCFKKTGKKENTLYLELTPNKIFVYHKTRQSGNDQSWTMDNQMQTIIHVLLKAKEERSKREKNNPIHRHDSASVYPF